MPADLAGRLFTRLFGPPAVLPRSDGGEQITRWTVWGDRSRDGAGVYLHRVAGADPGGAVLHTHPWGFVSLILWGGYWETTTAHGRTDPAAPLVRRWFGPGRILHRAADRLHRVEVPAGRACWTLFVHGRRVGGFGFWCPGGGFVGWRPGIGRPGGCDGAATNHGGADGL